MTSSFFIQHKIYVYSRFTFTICNTIGFAVNLFILDEYEYILILYFSRKTFVDTSDGNKRVK